MMSDHEQSRANLNERTIANSLTDRTDRYRDGRLVFTNAWCSVTHVISFLNAEQAAQFLGGLNTRTVTGWSREGYLPAYPLGEGKRRIWRYFKEDLAAWMLGRRHGGSDAS